MHLKCCSILPNWLHTHTHHILYVGTVLSNYKISVYLLIIYLSIERRKKDNRESENFIIVYNIKELRIAKVAKWRLV